MVECPHCSRRHKDEAGVEKCRVAYERRAARIAKKQAEVERRRTNQAHRPYENLIRALRHEGKNWDQIVSELKKHYPSPEEVGHPLGGDTWNAYKVAWTWAEKWPLPLSRDQKAELLMEKHHVGTFISIHPAMFLYEYVNELRSSPLADEDAPIYLPSELVAWHETLLEKEEVWNSLD